MEFDRQRQPEFGKYLSSIESLKNDFHKKNLSWEYFVRFSRSTLSWGWYAESNGVSGLLLMPLPTHQIIIGQKYAVTFDSYLGSTFNNLLEKWVFSI